MEADTVRWTHRADTLTRRPTPSLCSDLISDKGRRDRHGASRNLCKLADPVEAALAA